MDEAMVRARAEAHGRATVAGDLKTAGADLDKSAYAAAGEVMKKMPSGLSGCEIADARSEDDDWIVAIRYLGDGASATVESRWAEGEAGPKIVDLKVL